jgi:hypothetical protein
MKGVQLPVPITTNNCEHYVKKFVSDLATGQQFSLARVLCFSPPIKLIAMI